MGNNIYGEAAKKIFDTIQIVMNKRPSFPSDLLADTTLLHFSSRNAIAPLTYVNAPADFTRSAVSCWTPALSCSMVDLGNIIGYKPENNIWKWLIAIKINSVEIENKDIFSIQPNNRAGGVYEYITTRPIEKKYRACWEISFVDDHLVLGKNLY